MKEPIKNHNKYLGIADQTRSNIHGVTMHEAGEIIRRTGIEKGYVPISEYKLDIGDGSKRRIDWVWVKKDMQTLVAAFEIEGGNVNTNSVDFDLKKLKFLCSKHTIKHCYIAIYNVRFDQINMKWKTLSGTGKNIALKKIDKEKIIKLLSESELLNLISLDIK